MTKQRNAGDVVDDVADSGALAPPDAYRPLEMLRHATSDDHRRLEAAIHWMEAFQSYQSYRQLLERFALVVPPLERAIAPYLASQPPPQFDPGVRTRWLASDLAALTPTGEPGQPHPQASDEPPMAARSQGQAWQSLHELPPREFEYIDSLPAAIGAQYVVEGSSLGGQFLSRQLHDRLQLTAADGGAYFAAYGTATGARWQSFKQWANLHLADPRSIPLATEAAKLTFARFGKALAGFAYE